MTKLSTGIIVTRTKRKGVEVIRAYTPLEWRMRQASLRNFFRLFLN